MTSPVVEIVGPAGIGKTTLLQSLIKEQGHGNAYRLLSIQQLLSVPRFRAPRSLSSLLSRYVLSANDPIPSKLFFRKRSVTKTFLDNASDEWQDFISSCIDIAANDRRTAVRRLLALSWIQNTCATRIAAESLVCDAQLVLMDEPVGYRPSFFDPLSKTPSRAMKKYYEAVPLPAAIIHVTADLDTVVERVIGRRTNGKVSIRHLGLSSSDLRKDTEWAVELAHFGVMTMKKRGVPVLEVAGEDDISSNVEQISNFLQYL